MNDFYLVVCKFKFLKKQFCFVKWITYEQYLELTSGSKDLNALSYLKGLPSVSKEDLLNSMKNNSKSTLNI